MNYLAHAFLSPDDPEQLMGNLWGDLLKPRDYEALTPGVLNGIIIHKAIDTYTDQHGGVDEINNLIRPYQSKYTPVVADVLMDYILSKYWDQFQDEAIETYCKKKYGIVSEYLHLIPERLHPRINRMLENHWLESCKNRDRMEVTLHMLSRRASFENKIREAMLPYDLHEKRMDEIFLSFFEDLRNHLNPQSGG